MSIQGKSKKVQHPEILPLPTSSKIANISVAKDAGHAILIAETGEVYFVGMAHRGEDGETSKQNSSGICIIIYAVIFMFLTLEIK